MYSNKFKCMNLTTPAKLIMGGDLTPPSIGTSLWAITRVAFTSRQDTDSSGGCMPSSYWSSSCFYLSSRFPPWRDGFFKSHGYFRQSTQMSLKSRWTRCLFKDLPLWLYWKCPGVLQRHPDLSIFLPAGNDFCASSCASWTFKRDQVLPLYSSRS